MRKYIRKRPLASEKGTIAGAGLHMHRKTILIVEYIE